MKETAYKSLLQYRKVVSGIHLFKTLLSSLSLQTLSNSNGNLEHIYMNFSVG